MNGRKVKNRVFSSAIVIVAIVLLALALGLAPGASGGDSLAQPPSELTEVGRLDGGPAYQAIHASGGFVYGLVYSGGWLEIVDVSDPADPFVRSTLDLPWGDGHDLWYGEWEGHQYVFTGHRGGGVTMVDVSNPDAPVVVSTVDTLYIHKGLQSVGHYLYYSEHPAGSGEGGLRIYDFSGGALTEVGNWLQGPPCAVDGKELAVRSDGRGVYQYNEWHPEWDEIECGGPNEKLLLYDTTDKSAPSHPSYFPPSTPRGPDPADWTDMALSPDDHYLYLAHGEDGMLIYDVSISSTLSLAATVGESLYEVAHDPACGALYASSAPVSSTLYTIDVREPISPSIGGAMPGVAARDLWVDGEYLYATTEEAKLIVFAIACQLPTPTSTPTATPSSTPTNTPTPTPTSTLSPSPNEVPEPLTLLLLGSGLAVLAGYARYRRDGRR